MDYLYYDPVYLTPIPSWTYPLIICDYSVSVAAITVGDALNINGDANKVTASLDVAKTSGTYGESSWITTPPVHIRFECLDYRTLLD